jgi:hypothetical protein
MNLWLNQRPYDLSRRASRSQVGLTLAVLLIFCNGCGGSAAPSSIDNAAANSTTPPAAPLDTATDTTTTQTAPDRNTGSQNTAKAKHGRGEVWVDEKGQKWFGDVPMDAFFDQPYTVASNLAPIGGNASTTAVAGNTPATGDASPEMVETPTTTAGTDTPAAAAGNGSWAELISETELDNEVKSIRNYLNENLQSVSNYNSSMLMIPPKAATLGALAGVAMEHSNAVSWKDDAKYIRDLAKQMNSDTLRSGPKDQKRLLGLYESISDTLNRSRPAGLAEPPESDGFSEVSEMRLLMHRMEESEKRMKTEAGTDGAFASRKDMVAHEASLMATLAKIVTLPGYGYEDDAKFKAYANEVVKSAIAIKSAAESNDFATYELSLTKVSTTCSNCHSEYKNN